MIYQISPKQTALLLIDPQKEYFDTEGALYTPNAEAIRPALKRLRDAAKKSGVATVLILHEHKADGSDAGRMGDFDPTPVFVEGTRGVEPIDELADDADLTLKKTRYSAFVGTKLHEELQRRGVDTVIVTGLMTNFCCVTTARHAHDLDYRTLFVADASSGPDMPDLGFGAIVHSDILANVATSLAAGVAEVVTAEEAIKRFGA